MGRPSQGSVVERPRGSEHYPPPIALDSTVSGCFEQPWVPRL